MQDAAPEAVEDLDVLDERAVDDPLADETPQNVRFLAEEMEVDTALAPTQRGHRLGDPGGLLVAQTGLLDRGVGPQVAESDLARNTRQLPRRGSASLPRCPWRRTDRR